MAKKGDKYYFNNFIECAECACSAAALLEKTLSSFDSKTLPAAIEEMHKIEHEADVKKHELMAELMHAFITPIEREDIMLLSQNIDQVTDCIEDVLLRVFINNVNFINPETLRFTGIIIRCCNAMRDAMKKFPEFRKDAGLHDLIVEINRLEEEGDRIFITSMRKLHTGNDDPVSIIAWREIYIYLEKCADACEHVADVVEGVIMKNT